MHSPIIIFSLDNERFRRPTCFFVSTIFLCVTCVQNKSRFRLAFIFSKYWHWINRRCFDVLFCTHINTRSV